MNLIEASGNGNLKAVKKFIKAGADVHFKDKYRRTSLHRASANGHLKIAELLKQHGAKE